MTLSPSELAGRPDGDAVEIGGRVIDARASGITLADALGSIGVDGVTATLGELLVVSATWSDGRLLDPVVVTRRVPTRFDERGDVRRFLFDGVGRALSTRDAATRAIRDTFAQRGFIEVTTPLRVPCPGLDPHLVGVAAGDLFLATSPEYQMKRLLVGGVPKCFQLSTCFRGDELGRLHHPEFTMVEWYRAFAGYVSMMDDTESLVRAVARAVRGDETLSRGDTRIDVSGRFRRMTVADAFSRFAGVGDDELCRAAADDEDRYFALMVDVVEPALAATGEPIFLHEFPRSQASLAQTCPHDPRFAERFELYVAGVELCNGFGELTDPKEQRARFVRDQATRRARGVPSYPLDERFLSALEEGLPPSAGNALGLDRLLMLATGARSIAEVVAFPPDVL